MSQKVKLCFLSLCLFFTFCISTLSTYATDFKGKEEQYIKLCSSSKLTNSQQSTCKEFNTYLQDKNKKLSEASANTKKEAQETQNSLENIEEQLEEYAIKIKETQNEIIYINHSIDIYSQEINEKNQLLEDRLYAMQVSLNSNMFVSYILNANNLSDLIRRMINIREITSYEKDLIDDLCSAMKEVEKQKTTLSLLQESLQKDQASSQQLQKDYSTKLAKQNQDIANYDLEVSQNQESMEVIEANLAAIQKAAQESQVKNVAPIQPLKPSSSKSTNQKDETPSQNDTNNNLTQNDETQDNSQNQNTSNNETTSQAQLGINIANKALTRQGYMYVWGGCHSMSEIMNPSQTAFDCSGLVNWAHYQCGVNIGVQYTKSLLSCGIAVSKNQIQPGDIILFSNNGSASGVHHVGIYIGNNQMVHAPTTGLPVQVVDLSYSYWQNEWYTVRRLY